MTWNGKPSDFNAVIQSDVAEFRNKAALYALRGLILSTPVDTGRARGGWTVGVGRITSKDRGVNSQAAAIGEGLAAINASKSQPFATIYITNTIPYLSFVNFGTKHMPGRHFVETVFNNLRVKFG